MSNNNASFYRSDSTLQVIQQSYTKIPETPDDCILVYATEYSHSLATYWYAAFHSSHPANKQNKKKLTVCVFSELLACNQIKPNNQMTAMTDKFRKLSKTVHDEGCTLT
jgi:hypothetical protein